MRLTTSFLLLSGILANLVSTKQATAESVLLIDPEVSFKESTVEFTSRITPFVDKVYAGYGVDITHYRRRRSLSHADQKAELPHPRQRSVVTAEGQDGTDGKAISTSKMQAGKKSGSHVNPSPHRRRQQDATQDYYFLYGGDMFMNYLTSKVDAIWDRYYYWLGEYT